MHNRKQQWDVFRSKPRVIREAANSSRNWTLYLLQCLKLLIYVFSHIFVFVGSFASKSMIMILSTNFSNRTSSLGGNEIYHKTCGANDLAVNEYREHEISVLLALLIIQLLPDFFAILQSIYRLLSFTTKDYGIFKLVVICEAFRCAGLSLLLFIVFPNLDITHCSCLMCANVFFPYLSELLLVFADEKRSATNRFMYTLKLLPRAIMCSVCLGAAFLWGIINTDVHSNNLLPVAMILYGIGNWETWVAKNHSEGYLKELFRLKYGLRKLNWTSRIVVSLIRMVTVSGCAYYATVLINLDVSHFSRFLNFKELAPTTYHLIYLALGIVLLNFFIRLSVRFLAAMKMQLVTAFHPALVLPPLLVVLSYEMCHKIPLCVVDFLLKPFALNFLCLPWTESEIFSYKFGMSILAIACYIFWCYKYLSSGKIRKMDEIIDSMPIFLNGCAVENSITVFRHIIGKRDIMDDLEDDTHVGPFRIINSEIDKTVTLYVCATMWHETRNEMIQMIKSIMKLDEEHALRLSEKNQNIIKFRLEVHIFFDDAWENNNECGRIPNEYFKLLFELLVDLTSSPDNPNTEPWSRILANTSYGGRLVVKLPAGTLLFVHLKDKQLIRHKKRWSQVMYMYYLLGHRIMDSHLSVEDRQLQADNTYILAIDGDSKFEPEAVIKLLHLMNTKSDIGCACGRIHPIGMGVMVWYQKFEYAIAHWFQKAAEHVFGCVLCAPGCFSLFRASALMDDNIMHKYTKTAFEPRHFVQYDQGEDRWLSTLMLKQGYRIEYAAGADAETYAPEGFEEFFNQRRRWTPSSVANTLDLLADYKLACQNNASISKLYIMYQMIVIGFSLLGPAIIFTMLVYAQVAAFGMDSSRVLIYNAIPVCIFIFSCFAFDSSVQLFFAKVASIVYAFIMLAVLIATTQQIVLETIFSPTSMFVLAMVLIFLFASLMHPKEFSNILYGAIFFLMIPSTYVFLSLYSLVNLNVINWGTREAVAKATGKPVASDKVGERWVKRLGFDNEDSVIYRILPCLRPPQPSSENVRALERKMERTERLLKTLQKDNENSNAHDAVSMLNTIADEERRLVGKKSEALPFRKIDLSTTRNPALPFDNFMEARRGLWMDCEYLQSCDRGKLKNSEERFWDQIIDKYLRPIESTPKEQSFIAKGLVGLRNRIAFSIIILNGLLVLAIFLLQRHKDVLSIKLTPHEGFTWTKMNETTGKFEQTTEALKVDPLGLLIIVFLMGILIVQTIGMIIHRLNTLVESLHEVSEMEDVHFESSKIKSKTTVLNEARQMIDVKDYEMAHGADGYVRNGKMEQKYLNNVLYKLEREDENKQPPRRAKRLI